MISLYRLKNNVSKTLDFLLSDSLLSNKMALLSEPSVQCIGVELLCCEKSNDKFFLFDLHLLYISRDIAIRAM